MVSSTASGAPLRRSDSHKNSHWLAAVLWRHPRLLARLLSLRARLRRGERRAAVGLSAAALLLALSGAPASASAITVADGEVGIVANGKCSLIEAIANANDTTNGRPHADCRRGNPTGADEVVLPPGGMFILTQADNDFYGRSGLPVITGQVTLAGNGSTLRRDPTAEPFRILAVAATGDLTLRDTTVSGGYATYDQTDTDHWAATSGAGILSAGNLAVFDSVITGGEARNDAGGIFVISGTALVEGTTVSDNDAGDGGGITKNSGELIVRRSTISGNRGYAGGGLLSFGPLLVEASVFYDNHGVVGGAINNNYEGEATIRDSLFYKNGRNAITNGDVMVISGSTIMRNGGGGGVASSGPLAIINSTISGNDGSGVVVSYDTTRVIHSTITGNSATRGGGAYVAAFFDEWFTYDCFSGFLKLEDSIVSGNTATEGPEIYARFIYFRCFGAAGTYGSLIGHDGDPGVVNVDVQPGNVPTEPLASIMNPSPEWNGGPTPTHALPLGSPAIDAVPSAECLTAPVGGVDQRGQLRNHDGDGVSSDKECDLGAFEAQGEDEPTLKFRSNVPLIAR